MDSNAVSMDDSTRDARAGTTTTTVDGARARDDPARVRVRVVVVGEGEGDVRDVETRVVDDALDATDGVGDDDDARVVRARARARRRRRGNSRCQVARARVEREGSVGSRRRRDATGSDVVVVRWVDGFRGSMGRAPLSWLEIFSRIAPSAADPDIVIVRPWLFRSARALCASSS